MIDQTKLDELKRTLTKTGRGSFAVIPHSERDGWGLSDTFDLDLLRDLVALAERHKEEVDAREIWIGGYEAGWEECAEDIRPICTPSMAERAWDRLRKP